MANKEVTLAAFSVGGSGCTMSGPWDDDEVEVLIGFDEGVGNLHGGGGVDVAVLLADDEH